MLVLFGFIKKIFVLSVRQLFGNSMFQLTRFVLMFQFILWVNNKDESKTPA